MSVTYHVGSKNERDGSHRLCSPVRAHDVQGLEERRARVAHLDRRRAWVAAATRSRPKTKPCSGRRCRRNTFRWRSGSKPTAWPRLRIDDEAFRREREVVKEERRMRVENQPYGRLSEIIFDHAFTTHPYKHPTIGSMLDLESASIADVREFHKTYYVPENATVTIVGDFEAEQTLQMVNQYLARVPKAKRPVPRDLPKEPAQTKERRAVVEEAVAATRCRRRVSHHLRRPPGRVSAAHRGQDPVGRPELADHAGAGLQKAAGPDRVRQCQHHRGSEPVLRRGDRATGANAGSCRARAHRRVREDGAESRSSTASYSVPRISSRVTTSSVASRTRTKRSIFPMRRSSTTTSRPRTASSTSSRTCRARTCSASRRPTSRRPIEWCCTSSRREGRDDSLSARQLPTPKAPIPNAPTLTKASRTSCLGNWTLAHCSVGRCDERLPGLRAERRVAY